MYYSVIEKKVNWSLATCIVKFCYALRKKSAYKNKKNRNLKIQVLKLKSIQSYNWTAKN